MYRHHDFEYGGHRHYRFFERGILKYAVLDLIKEKPRHGYDIIQELEDKFHGFYTPSAGSVYPILQLLEDQGFVRIDQKEGKKIYSITEEGEDYLDDHEDELEHLKRRSEHFEERFGPYAYDLLSEVKDIMPLIIKNIRHGALKDGKKMTELRIALKEFREKVETIFQEEGE